MKHVLKSILPRRMAPVARRLYSRFFSGPSKSEFSKKQYEALTALKCIVSYNKYGGYCVPESSRHRPAAQQILAHAVHEPKTIEFITSHCAHGDIVHAGTYFGDFLPALSKACALNAKIWAFEPNPESYRCATITLKINDIANVTLTNAGLGTRQEKLLMKTADENGRALGGSSRIIDQKSAPVKGLEIVQIVAIDDIVGVDRVVSILQLDVEGHEKEALTGAIKTIQRCHPIIIIEILPGCTLLDSEWFAEHILSQGYGITEKIHKNAVLRCKSQS